MGLCSIGSNCFNPCFNGSVLRSPKRGNTDEDEEEVSILVLMEVCLEEFGVNAYVKDPWKFQSLF